MIIRQPSDVERVFESSHHTTLQDGWCKKALANAKLPRVARIHAIERMCIAWGCEVVVYPIVPEVCGQLVTLQQLVAWFQTDTIPAREDAKRRVWQRLGDVPILEQRLAEKPAWQIACWGNLSWAEKLSYRGQLKKALVDKARVLSATEALWLHLVVGRQPGDWVLNTADVDDEGCPVVISIHQPGSEFNTIGLEYNLHPAKPDSRFGLAVGFV